MSPPEHRDVPIGSSSFRVLERAGFGVVIEGTLGSSSPSAYLDPVFDDPVAQEAFFAWVDQEGLVVARGLVLDPTPYRRVRGKRSRGRLSQGEFFHHDGCSTPTRPRIVEIRCPPQDCVRAMGTSVARFPDVVRTMLLLLPPTLRRAGALEQLRDQVAACDVEHIDWEPVQGVLNRVIRQLDAECARAFFRDVEGVCPSFCESWTLGESRFMANHNDTGSTAQHRRSCRTPWISGVPNGGLIKRWPAEEMQIAE